MNKTYCPAPWMSLNILPGEARPCCQWDGGAENISGFNRLSKEDIPDMFKSIREDMLAGKEIPGCKQCYSAESVGSKSRRLELINDYGVVTDINTKALDISFDNVCNLKCRGCCTFSSHLWHNDEKEIYGRTFIDKKYIENELTIELNELDYVNVSGGEPFLSKKYEKFSKELNEKNVIDNVHLCISTNGTQRPPKDVYQSMVRARKLSVSISIDGVGNLNEYFRSNSNFSDCLDTIKFLKNLKKIRGSKETGLFIHTTVSIYNVNLLKDIEEFFSIYPEYEVTHRLLYWPEQLCIKNIPEDLKEKLRPIVKSYGEKYIDVLNELNNPGKDLLTHFINYTDSLDRLRNESLESVNPWLYDYIKTYNKSSADSKAFFLTQIRG